jgi:hypothetical protein
MLRSSLLCLVLLGVVNPASATSWADGMFDELSRDFGSVPRGQQLTHPFRIVNNTGKPVRISSVRVSCGCVDARALKNNLAPGEETAIYAQMDTRRFFNSKTVTIFVQFDQPRSEEVRLWVQANSRDDVVFAPENITFGKVKRGATPENKVQITFLGNVQTQVTEIKSESNYVQATLKEVRRETGEVTYEINAKVRPDTPAGKWYTDVWLKTNNAAIPKLRVPVTVEIEASLSVTPNTVSLGQVKAGTESDRKVIIRGVQPFRITGVSGADDQIRVQEPNNESKTVHVLTVTLTPQMAGDLSRTIRVQTDMKTSSDIEFVASAQVVP